MEQLLQINHLSKTFGKNQVLKDIDFTVNKGDVISIIGASGSGKSTLLRCINLLETPTAGEILFHEKNVADRRVKAHEYRSHVGMVFQSFNLFSNMSVLKNCMVGQMKVLKKSKEEAKKTALYYLEKVGMTPYINAKPRQISGGQKQRVAIAGVIAMEPKCIVLDEPTAMLDPRGRKEVMDTITQLNQDKDITVILITHHMDEAARAQRVVVLHKGEVALDGKPADVFSNVEKLHDMGLAAPDTVELCWELNKVGFDLPLGRLNAEECAQTLYEVLKV